MPGCRATQRQQSRARVKLGKYQRTSETLSRNASWVRVRGCVRVRVRVCVCACVRTRLRACVAMCVPIPPQLTAPLAIFPLPEICRKQRPAAPGSAVELKRPESEAATDAAGEQQAGAAAATEYPCCIPGCNYRSSSEDELSAHVLVCSIQPIGLTRPKIHTWEITAAQRGFAAERYKGISLGSKHLPFQHMVDLSTISAATKKKLSSDGLGFLHHGQHWEFACKLDGKIYIQLNDGGGACAVYAAYHMNSFVNSVQEDEDSFYKFLTGKIGSSIPGFPNTLDSFMEQYASSSKRVTRSRSKVNGIVHRAVGEDDGQEPDPDCWGYIFNPTFYHGFLPLTQDGISTSIKDWLTTSRSEDGPRENGSETSARDSRYCAAFNQTPTNVLTEEPPSQGTLCTAGGGWRA